MTNREAIKTLEANYPDACFEQLREAVDAAIKALKAQDTDTISRKAAIDAIDKALSRTFVKPCGEMILKDVPSAQPKKRTEERTETHACDLISRQAAIDAILAVTGNSSVRELYEHVQEHGLSDMWSGGVNAAIDIIIAVPPVQPELCEDTISRQTAIDAMEDER